MLKQMLSYYLLDLEESKEYKERTSNYFPRRTELMERLVNYIAEKSVKNETVNLNFICTHNARRSHIAQSLAAAIAEYKNIQNINCYSGGVEVTQIHPNAVATLQAVHFEIETIQDGTNPRLWAKYGDKDGLELFSKKYDHQSNPQDGFAAVLVCSDAEEACPFIPTAEIRVPITFDDPKIYDNTPEAQKGYASARDLIAIDLLYIFGLINNKLNK